MDLKLKLQNTFYFLGIISFFVFLCIFAPWIAFIIGILTAGYLLFKLSHIKSVNFFLRICFSCFLTFLANLFFASLYGLGISIALMAFYLLWWFFQPMKYSPLEAWCMGFFGTTAISFLKLMGNFSLNESIAKVRNDERGRV